MADRKKALEEKKRRLEELKARRAQRGSQTISATEQAQARIESASNLEDYIDGLLKAPAAGQPEPAPSAPAPAPAQAPDNDAAKSISEDEEGKESISATAVAPVAPAPAVKVETFEMSTQTNDEDFPPPSDYDEEEEEQLDQDAEKKKEETQEQAAAEKQEEEEEEEAKVLSAEEVEKELSSDTFSSFLNATSKKVERVLGSAVLADLLTDYDGETDGAERAASKATDGSKFISSRQIYECPKWTATRDITDMDWSPLHRELMICGYHMPTSANKLSDPKGSTAVRVLSPDDTPSDSMAPRSAELQSDGLALVWNLAMPNRPEHIFTCGSPVTTTRFHPSESSLIIGGCQSGQVVVWDVRAGRMPVQKSTLTTNASGNSKGHTHPICSMEIIEGGGGLVTGALDGRINFWSMANLRDPAESLQLGENVSCLAVAPESETLVCGDDTGNLYTIQSNQSSLGGGGGQRSKRKAAKLEPGESESHFGMITALSTKSMKAAARAGFLRGSGGLVLTAGVDWTVKLWGPAYTDKPLLSLVSHSYDYISDVQWSPAHPSLMATASSNGTLGLWNFAQSLEEPISGTEGIVVEPDGGSGRGLNKIKWSSDGRRMLVASMDRVHVLVMAEDVVKQKGDEDARMMNHITARGLLDRE
eukprot:CAMPEP_0176004356 /NCGR_PEP_ID=MMETSP0120_2-20121206/1651_1 /TAXON_ID=160619 /ORGANISM="Kryptoperidinium foliaceum, Strain CCMP 1326" /LENGTH=647 /DNA_ID=CAMNT_0017337035 /DNA_START=208 /DNA_END=2151 /DNA_ORIENTATION=+